MNENPKAPTWKYTEPSTGAEEYYTNHVFWTGVDLVFGELLQSSENLANNILNKRTASRNFQGSTLFLNHSTCHAALSVAR
jgi:hypothetical protein